jgi:hypothetical protein
MKRAGCGWADGGKVGLFPGLVPGVAAWLGLGGTVEKEWLVVGRGEGAGF